MVSIMGLAAPAEGGIEATPLQEGSPPRATGSPAWGDILMSALAAGLIAQAGVGVAADVATGPATAPATAPATVECGGAEYRSTAPAIAWGPGVCPPAGALAENSYAARAGDCAEGTGDTPSFERIVIPTMVVDRGGGGLKIGGALNGHRQNGQSGEAPGSGRIADETMAGGGVAGPVMANVGTARAGASQAFGADCPAMADAIGAAQAAATAATDATPAGPAAAAANPLELAEDVTAGEVRSPALRENGALRERETERETERGSESEGRLLVSRQARERKPLVSEPEVGGTTPSDGSGCELAAAGIEGGSIAGDSGKGGSVKGGAVREIGVGEGGAREPGKAGGAGEIARQIVDRARVLKFPDRTEVEIRLKPETLGRVVLKVSMESGRLSARFEVNDPEARLAIETRMDELRKGLADQGLVVQDLAVSVGGGAGGQDRGYARGRDGYPHAQVVSAGSHSHEEAVGRKTAIARWRRTVGEGLDLIA